MIYIVVKAVDATLHCSSELWQLLMQLDIDLSDDLTRFNHSIRQDIFLFEYDAI